MTDETTKGGCILTEPRANQRKYSYRKRRKNEEDFNAEALEATECRALWKAVLNRALLDLKWGCKPVAYNYYQDSHRGSKGKKSVYRQKVIDTETVNAFRAKGFLAVNNPDFCTVCSLAGVDPSYIVEHLVGVGQPLAKYGRAAHSRISIFDKNISLKDVYADLQKAQADNPNNNLR